MILFSVILRFLNFIPKFLYRHKAYLYLLILQNVADDLQMVAGMNNQEPGSPFL